MSINMNAMIRRDLNQAESAFRRACEQVFVLNSQVERITKRYNDAEGDKARRYQLRLRLSVLEGVRNMFYEFAAKKADDIVLLQRRVLETDDNQNDDSDSDLSELAFGYGHGSGDSAADSDGFEYC